MCYRWKSNCWIGQHGLDYNLSMREVSGRWDGLASEPGPQSLPSLFWHTGSQVKGEESKVFTVSSGWAHWESTQTRSPRTELDGYPQTCSPGESSLLSECGRAWSVLKVEESKKKYLRWGAHSMETPFGHPQSIMFSQANSLLFNLQYSSRSSGPNL